MKSIKGTKTEGNILKAFAGESQARNRYSFFAKQAKEDGYVLVQQIFEETAAQEQAHAKRLFRWLEGGPLEITCAYPAGAIKDTYSNLLESAAGEHEEATEMYPDFAKVAQEEGFPDIAAAMRNIAIAEKYHEQRYLDLAKKIKDGTMFHNDTPTTWRCLHCGCIVSGTGAPKVCPACGHDQKWFAREVIVFESAK